MINTAYVSISALPYSGVHVLASDGGEFCFDLVLNALVTQSEIRGMFGGAISARLLRRPSRTQTKRETAINQRPICVSVVPYGRIQSITILSDLQQRSRGVWEPVKTEDLPEPAWISAGSVRFGSVGSDARELSTMIIYWTKEHQKHTKRSSSPA